MSDAQLAATIIENNAVLHTADTDFLRFQGLRCFNPLTSAHRTQIIADGVGADKRFISRTEPGATLFVQGAEWKMYVVECSEDLINWIPISTNSAPSTVTDPAATNAPQRFYRTVELP